MHACWVSIPAGVSVMMHACWVSFLASDSCVCAYAQASMRKRKHKHILSQTTARAQPIFLVGVYMV